MKHYLDDVFVLRGRVIETEVALCDYMYIASSLVTELCSRTTESSFRFGDHVFGSHRQTRHFYFNLFVRRRFRQQVVPEGSA
jgi:hypothetical protein